jgi:hypothetical protein
MSVSIRFTLALALSVAAFSAHADERTAVADPTRAARVTENQAALQQLRKEHTGEAAPKAITATVPGQPRANPVRTYPPSCLADPLPDTPSGPLYTNNNVSLYTNANGREAVTITIWRVACSSDTFYNSATLMRIQRQSRYEGDTSIYPLFPSITASQGGIGFDDSQGRSFVRVASEPNTVIADTLVDSPVVFSTTYVLENYPYASAGLFDFNLPYSVRFWNLAAGEYFYINSIPLYNPTSTTYPDAFANLPISGYFGTNWYDPAHSGEGLLMHVFEPIGDTTGMILSFSWFTYDPSGRPFWLFGSAGVQRGARTANSSVVYRTDGSFAGNGPTGTAPQFPWGTMTITFPTCNKVRFAFAANEGLPANVPQGSGTRNWVRIANINGLPCE